MPPELRNHNEAMAYALSLTDHRARAGLRGVHTLLLECSGATPLHFLERRLCPRFPLDLRVLYAGVSRLFSEWTETVGEVSQRECDNVAQLVAARQYVTELRSERERIAQSNLLGILCEADLREGEVVDALFCCELLHPILSDDESLDAILSGEAEQAAGDWSHEDGWGSGLVER